MKFIYSTTYKFHTTIFVNYSIEWAENHFTITFFNIWKDFLKHNEKKIMFELEFNLKLIKLP